MNGFEPSRELVDKLREKYNSPVWITQEGEYVPLAIMNRRHMANIYKYLNRRLESIIDAEELPDWLTEGMLLYFLEKDITNLIELNDEIRRLISMIETWWAKRGWPLPIVVDGNYPLAKKGD